MFITKGDNEWSLWNVHCNAIARPCINEWFSTEWVMSILVYINSTNIRYSKMRPGVLWRFGVLCGYPTITLQPRFYTANTEGLYDRWSNETECICSTASRQCIINVCFSWTMAADVRPSLHWASVPLLWRYWDWIEGLPTSERWDAWNDRLDWTMMYPDGSFSVSVYRLGRRQPRWSLRNNEMMKTPSTNDRSAEPEKRLSSIWD